MIEELVKDLNDSKGRGTKSSLGELSTSSGTFLYYLVRGRSFDVDEASSWEIWLSMRQISPGEQWELRDLRVIFKNHMPNMDHKHFQSAKRPFSVIFRSKATNQVIRYKHKGQFSAKIMLEQKADFLKYGLN